MDAAGRGDVSALSLREDIATARLQPCKISCIRGPGQTAPGGILTQVFTGPGAGRGRGGLGGWGCNCSSNLHQALFTALGWIASSQFATWSLLVVNSNP